MTRFVTYFIILLTIKIANIFKIHPVPTTNATSEVPIDKVYTAEQLDCIKSAMLAACLIVQTQYEDTENSETPPGLLNRHFLKKLLKNFSDARQLDLLFNHFDELNQSYKIDKFLKCLLTRVLAELVESDLTRLNADSLSKVSVDLDGNDDERELARNDRNVHFRVASKLLALLNLNRSPRLVEFLIVHVLNTLARQIENKNMPNFYVEYHLCELVFRFETKYPAQFDACLKNVIILR
jgi:hypothetical protein